MHKSVYNRIPFLVSGSADALIDDFTVDVFSELKSPLEKADDQYLDEDFYTPAEISLAADMVAVNLLTRKILLNQEGDGSDGSAGAAGKVLKRAKAGEAEAEFMLLKGSEGSRLLMEGSALLNTLKQSANRKAHALGFILDLAYENEFTMNVMAQPVPSVFNVQFKDCLR